MFLCARSHPLTAHVTRPRIACCQRVVFAVHLTTDPQLVLWLPTLCHKMNVPYAIVRTKGDLGKLVHLKKTTSVCFTDVNPEDRPTFDKILTAVAQEVDYAKAMKTYGGGVRREDESQ